MKQGMTGGLALLLLAYGSVAGAHHSFAMFDQSKNLPLKGTVHDFQWTNPHAFIDVDVPNADGSVDLWKVELNSPKEVAAINARMLIVLFLADRRLFIAAVPAGV